MLRHRRVFELGHEFCKNKTNSKMLARVLLLLVNCGKTTNTGYLSANHSLHCTWTRAYGTVTRGAKPGGISTENQNGAHQAASAETGGPVGAAGALGDEHPDGAR